MFPITTTGYEALKEKLRIVKEEFEKMPAIIATARAKGDLKENAEYHAAREKQGLLKAEMDRVNQDLAQSQVIDPTKLPKDIVTFGKTVKLVDLDSKEETVFTIVGPAESDTAKQHISVTSQLVKGILGKKIETEATVVVPAGTKHYKILSIS